jgi:membrane fusion protein (multidrug efflux system)
VGVRTAQSALAASQAELAAARATASGAQTAPQQVSISKAQNRAAEAKIRQAEADIHNARLQLSYTSILAPVAGIVSQKSIQPGQYVQPGQLILSIVPLNDVWVIANFKETELQDMKVGESATVNVDTYPGLTFRGHIASIGAATGAKFSLLPPENATGNFVKVVQRIPVKIVFDKPLPRGVVLRPGMNVTANVNVRSERG